MRFVLPQTADEDVSRISYYVRIASILRGRIARGEWPVGTRIPNTEDLCAHYGVSRNTMRQALLVLQSEGLLKSGRGVGTVVVGEVPQLRRDASIREVVSNPLSGHPDLKITVLSLERVQEVPDFFLAGFPRHERYVRIVKRHALDSVTFAIAEFYLDEASFDSFPPGFEGKALLSQLVQEYGKEKFASWWQEISMSYPDYEMSQLLGCSMIDPIIVCRRRRFSRTGQVMLAGQISYRGDMFVYEITAPGSDAPGSRAKAIPEAGREPMQ